MVAEGKLRRVFDRGVVTHLYCLPSWDGWLSILGHASYRRPSRPQPVPIISGHVQTYRVLWPSLIQRHQVRVRHGLWEYLFDIF